MSEQLFRVTFFSASAMFAVMVLGLVDAIILPGMDRWSRRFFTVLFSVLVLCMMAYVIELSTYGVPNMMRVEKATAYSESLLASILLLMTTILLLHHSGEDWKSSVLFRIVAAVWFIYFVLLNASAKMVCNDNPIIRGFYIAGRDMLSHGVEGQKHG